jgi:heterodisulfide reductase subunit C2
MRMSANQSETKSSDETEEAILNTENLDPKFRLEIAQIPGGETLTLCFQCGKCTASCPIRRFDENFRPRSIAKAALLGLRNEVLASKEIWMCATCYSCTERCPQGVRITDVMRVLRNLAVKDGRIHPFFKKLSDVIAANGRIFNDDSFINEMRSDLGLSPISSISKEEILVLLQKQEETIPGESEKDHSKTASKNE